MNSSSNRQIVAAFFDNTRDAENAIQELRDHGFTSSEIGTSLQSEREGDIFSEAGAGPAEIHPQLTRHDHRSFWQKMKDFFSGERGDYGTRASERTQVTDNEFGAIRTSGYNIPERFHTRLASGAIYVTVESSREGEAEDILANNHGNVDHEFASGIGEDVAETPLRPESNAAQTAGSPAGWRIQLLSEVLRIEERAGKDVTGKDRKVA